MLLSSLLVGTAAISLIQATCQPNQVYTQQGVQWKCCQIGINWVPISQGCVDHNGLPVKEGEVKQVWSPHGLGFAHKCIRDKGIFTYHAIDCLQNVGGNTQVIPFGDSITHGDFQYKCVKYPNLLAEIVPTACKTQAGTYIPAGQSYRHCTGNGALCSNYECNVQGLQVIYTCKSCFINNSIILVGQQCPWQQHTCVCTQYGPTCR